MNATQSLSNIGLNETVASFSNYVFAPNLFECSLIVISIAVFIIGIIGNYLVIHVVAKNAHMRTITNMFIVNLAVGDFFVILICLPPTTIQNVTYIWWFGKTICKIIPFIQYVSVCISVLTLTAISYERYYAIVYPLKFQATKFRAKVIIFIIWVLAILTCLPMPFVIDLDPLDKSCHPRWDAIYQNIFDASIISILYILPMILISYTYKKVIKVLWKMDKSIGFDENEKAQLKNKCDSQHTTSMYSFSKSRDSSIPSNYSSAPPGAYSTTASGSTIAKSKMKNQLNARRKAAKMLICVAIMFAICFFPIHVLNIIRFIRSELTKSFLQEYGAVFYQISHILVYVNSCLNPLIYNFMSDNFRKEFKQTLCCINILNKSSSNIEYLASEFSSKHFSKNKFSTNSTLLSNKTTNSSSINSKTANSINMHNTSIKSNTFNYSYRSPKLNERNMLFREQNSIKLSNLPINKNNVQV